MSPPRARLLMIACCTASLSWLITGCATQNAAQDAELGSPAVPPAPAAQASAAAPPATATATSLPGKSTDDPFLPYREHTSGLLRESVPLFADASARGKVLIARVDKKTGARAFRLQVLFAYSARTKRRYETARNERAELLALVVVKRERTQCSRRLEQCQQFETIDIALKEADLRAAGPQGLATRVFPREGPPATLVLDKAAIQGVLARVDADPATRVLARARP